MSVEIKSKLLGREVIGMYSYIIHQETGQGMSCFCSEIEEMLSSGWSPVGGPFYSDSVHGTGQSLSQALMNIHIKDAEVVK
jgi:hypothetical protein